MNESTAWYSAWVRFWFARRELLGLHALRVFFGILVLCWLLPFSGYLTDFFSYHGWFDQQAFTEAGRTASDMVDRQNWSLLYILPDSLGALSAFYWGSIVVVALFTLGFFTRITSVLTWLIVVSFTANPLIEIDTDVLFRIVSFYLMIGYLLLHITDTNGSWLEKLLAPTTYWIGRSLKDSKSTCNAANLALRLMQVHFALAICIMGLHKLQMAEWWAGVAFWYPAHRPSTLTLEAINDLRSRASSYLSMLSLAAYVVLAWQIFFPAFAWKTGVFRWFLLGGAVVGCVGLMILYPIPLLGPTFLLICLCYLTDAEWNRLLSPLLRLVK